MEPEDLPDGRFDPVFFGAFSHKRKIAYAPSFGIPRIPDGMEEELRTYLESFSHLSVRERQGQGIVRDITGKDVPVVLDPTLLLERTDWAAAARDGGAGRGYILCYCISRPDALAPYIRRLAEETGLPVVQLCGVRQKVHPKARCILSAGPAEFLGLFRDAAYVCTNSFHGTVFSVQFQKPFFTAVAPAEMAAPESSRTFSLLSRLGLGERIIGKGDTADLTAPIDWAAVGERLGRERKLSLDYLRCALEDRPHTPEEAPVKAEERPLPHLADHTHCTGCTACASGCPKDAITMERDREGFAYPVIDGAACVRCGHCTAVCPVLRERPQSSMPAVFAAWNRNDEIRRDSTSGGVFTLLAEYILESGGVVFGAAFDGSQHLRHTACFRKEELWRLRGAKYVQSDLEGVFREVRRWLDQRPVLFSGHTLPGGRAVPLSGRTAGESDHLRPGVPRRALSRRVGGHGPEPGGAPAAAAAGGPFPQQGRRMEGQPFYRGLRRRHRGYRAAVPHGIRPGLRPGAVPAAQLLPLSLRLHDPGGRSDTGGFLGPAAG